MNDRTEKAATLQEQFRKDTGSRRPITRTMESYATYWSNYAEWLELRLNSQPLNLDVKVDDNWVEVKEPKANQYDFEEITERVEYHQRLEAYQQAKTVKEKIAELTKERDELKDVVEQWEGYFDDATGTHPYKKQLKAEQDKVKELVRTAYIDALKEKKHMDYDEPLTVGEHAEALIHADNYCTEKLKELKAKQQ